MMMMNTFTCCIVAYAHPLISKYCVAMSFTRLTSNFDNICTSQKWVIGTNAIFSNLLGQLSFILKG